MQTFLKKLSIISVHLARFTLKVHMGLEILLDKNGFLRIMTYTYLFVAFNAMIIDIIKHKALVVSITLILASCCVLGCAGKKESGEGPVVIKVAFWGGPEDITIITDAISEWQETHPGIRVELEHTPYRGYADKLLTRIAGGGAPDIICTEVDLFVTFQSKNVLLNLTPFIESDPEFQVSDFFPEVIDRFTVKDKLYCVPRDTAPCACIYYNKKIGMNKLFIKIK